MGPPAASNAPDVGCQQSRTSRRHQPARAALWIGPVSAIYCPVWRQALRRPPYGKHTDPFQCDSETSLGLAWL